MAESDGCILLRPPFASAEHGESDSGLFSLVLHPGDETQTENNNLGSSAVGSDVQPGHITVEKHYAPSLVEQLRNALGPQSGGPVSLNDPQMAQGRHANGVGEKMPKLPTHAKGKPMSTAGGEARRARDSNWNDEQKNELLMGKLKWFSDSLQQALGGDQSADHHGKSWSHQVADQLWKTHLQCQRQWDSLLKLRNAIHKHEQKIGKDASGTHVSFWDMTERQRATAKGLPGVFPKERYELMDLIIGIVEGVNKIPLWKASFQKSSGIAPETSTPLDSGITESRVVGQVAYANTYQEATINDSLAITQGNCEGAEDQKVKNDHDLVSMLVSKALKDALRPHISELQNRREDKQKHRAKVIELEERKLALEKQKFEEQKRVNPGRNASWGQVEPFNMTFNCSADGQHVQEYVQMTPSGMNFPHLQNAAYANIQYNTSATNYGHAARVGTYPNSEIDHGLLHRPPIAETGALRSSQILFNTSEAGNQQQVLPTTYDGRSQHSQHRDDPSEMTPSGMNFPQLQNGANANGRQTEPSNVRSNCSADGQHVQQYDQMTLSGIPHLQNGANANWRQAGPSNVRSNCSADGQHVQQYDQMTPSGIPHLQNAAYANLQYNTDANCYGQAARVGTYPNLEIDHGLLHQPPIANTVQAIQSSQNLFNTSEARNQQQVPPTNNDGRSQHSQHHDDPSEDIFSFLDG